MLSKKKEKVQVLSTAKLAEGIYEMWLKTDMAQERGAGRFIALYPKNKATLLPRPISICERDAERGALRIVYRVAGEGTKEFSTYRKGDTAEMLGVLGNGYPLKEAEGKTALLMGGGIGIPPMVQLAKELDCQVQIIAGYRDEQFLTEELGGNGALYIATEDGSAGTKGNVLDAVRENGLTADIIYACGPRPMLRAVKEYAAENDIECYLSMEERMACGIGACLACVCQSVEVDGHTHVHNKRICKDGPVFLSTEVELS